MVVYGDGRGRCPLHGVVASPPRHETDLMAGRFETACPSCGRELDGVLVDETAPMNPRNAYAASKCAQELYASTWARATGAAVTTLRYHNVYGPGMPRHTPYAGVAALFAAALARGEPPRVFEDGRQCRDFVHVRDVARATAAAIENDVHAVFNVGSGTARTVGDMARAMSRATRGAEPVTTGEYRLGDVRHIVADSSKLRRELGIMPLEDFEAGMAELAEFCKL
jgi:dTDP-L-rhamnose 4-epimerase